VRLLPSRHDTTAGLVLGVQSVPDGLATGLLAGLNPSAGLYGYMIGTAGGALFTSSAFMAVQGTGAMAIVIADVPGLSGDDAPGRALVTLALLTGAVMLVAGLLRLGSILRFVSNAVMVGFISAVGVNIVLGQLANLTGYGAEGANRVTRAARTLVRPDRWNAPTVLVGLATIALIVLLGRTKLGAMGLVVAVIATSVAVQVGGWEQVATLNDLGVTIGSLPSLELPRLRSIPTLIIPAVSLAFVGLVQGAGISATFPNPDGTYPDSSRDFVGQGVANLASGALQGMPVGGSVSATAINKEAGAQTRASLLVAAVVMAVVIVAFGDAVGDIAMPALAGLLILIGIRTVKPAQLATVWHVGIVQRVVLVVTFALTMLIPLQYAVLVGVGLSIVLHVMRQSNQVTIRQQVFDADGHLRRDRSSHPARHARGRDPAAVRKPVLRRCPGVRGDAPRGRNRHEGLRRDPPPPRAHRPRHDLHGRPAPLRLRPRVDRQQARARIGQRPRPRTAPGGTGHRRRRRRGSVSRRRAGRRHPPAGSRRRTGLDRITTLTPPSSVGHPIPSAGAADAARSRRRRMSGRFDIRCTTAGSASSPAV
jgi:sulfate permease, SulP family